MLQRLHVRAFKSLQDVEVHFPALTVLFGPNAAGKSNLIDAIQALSRFGTSRTLADAIAEPIRGRPIETFAFPPGGLPALLATEAPTFALEADLGTPRDAFRYRVEVRIAPRSGALTVSDEYLTAIDAAGNPKGQPAIEQVEGKIRLRRKGDAGRPRYEVPNQNFTFLSDLRLGGSAYRAIETARAEVSGWRTYYLDPRVAMRAEKSPADVRDIGVLGEEIAPFLYRLGAEHAKAFDAVRRTLLSVIPSVEHLSVDLDKRRGTLDVLVRQGGIDFSSRIVSEGTLRVLALCAIAVNPWSGSLIAFEEPENGVHPRRLELIAQLLHALAAERGRQVVVTTHSPLFCDAALRLGRARPGSVSLLNVRRGPSGTQVQKFDPAGPLFQDQEITAALAAGSEDGLFESLMLRGMLDE